jgi:hypothetical protein
MSKANRSKANRCKDGRESSSFPPDPDYKDPYGPKKGSNRTLRCLHCDQVVQEQDMRWTAKAGGDFLWYCPTIRCDGAGIGFDLEDLTGMLHEGEHGSSLQ